MKPKWIILIIIILFLAGGTSLTYHILVKKNTDFAYWHNLPSEVKRLSIVLEVERVWHKLFTPDIDTTITTTVTSALMQQSVIDGARWIVSMQEESGRFNYWFNPVRDEYSQPWDDNFLRQAGTAYSLSLAFEQTGDTAFLGSAVRNLKYLNNYKQHLDPDKAYYLFNGKAKLGGIALPMLCMLKIRMITSDSGYDTVLKQLAEMILYLQELYQTGQFKSTYVYRGDYEYEKNSGWESSIYPGEAMLALALMYNLYGDEKYRNSLDWAMAYYGNEGRWKTSSLITWSASAFSELFKTTGNRKYADYVFRMCNHTLRWQNLNPNHEVYGSFYGLPGIFTATTFEGVGDAVSVAEMLGEQALVEFYKGRCKIAYKWIISLQYNDNDPDLPIQAVGGFRGSLFDSVIRIDNTQHAVSALVKGLRYVYDKKPAIELSD